MFLRYVSELPIAWNKLELNLWKDKNGLLLRLLAISAVIFVSTAIVSREYDLWTRSLLTILSDSLRSLQEKSLRALWEKNNQLEVADQGE